MKRPKHLCRLSILLTVLLLCLTGCQKAIYDEDEPVTDGDGKVPVKLQVMKIEQVPFENTQTSTRAASLSELCTRLNLVLYQNGERVTILTQTSSDPKFGTLSVSVAPGSYQVLVIASNGSENPTLTTPSKITFKGADMSDTFYYYSSLEVGKEGVTKDISLSRVVAMIRMKLSDPMPSDVARMEFYYTGGSSTLDATHGVGCVNSKQTVDFTVDSTMVGKPTSYDLYTFPLNESSAVRVTIRAYNASGKMTKEMSVSGLPVKVNQITVCEGSFFSSGGTGSGSETGDDTSVDNTFQITIGDADWTEVKYKF